MDIKQKLEKVLVDFEEKNLNFLIEKEEKEPEPKIKEEPKQKGGIEEKIIVFLSENPNPSDEELRSWAEKESLDVHEVETAIYKLATRMVKFLTGGMSVQKGVAAGGVDSAQLKMGMIS